VQASLPTGYTYYCHEEGENVARVYIKEVTDEPSALVSTTVFIS